MTRTGKEYLESLHDSRHVVIDGQRVDDVTSHPAFRNLTRVPWCSVVAPRNPNSMARTVAAGAGSFAAFDDLAIVNVVCGCFFGLFLVTSTAM